MKDDQSTYFDSKEFIESLERYEKMRLDGENNYFDGDEIADIADYYFRSDEFQKSEKALEFGLKLHPFNTDILISKANNLLSQGKSKEARVISESICDSGNQELLFLKGEIELNEGNDELANIYFAQSIETNEQDKGLISDIIIQLLDHHSFILAQKWLDNALSLFPESKTFNELQADLYSERKDFDFAIPAYNKLLDEFAYDTYYWEQLGRIYFELEDWPKSKECFEFLEAIDSSNEYSHIMKAHCVLAMNDYTEAERLFKELHENNLESSTILYFYALCLSKKHSDTEACNYFVKAIDISDGNEPGEVFLQMHTQAAISLLNTGNPDRALKYIDKALEIEPDDSESLIVKGNILLKLNKVDEAELFYIMAIEKGAESDDEILKSLIVSFIENNDFELSYRILSKIFSNKEIDKTAYQTLFPLFALCSWILDKDDFIEVFKTSYELEKELTLSTFSIVQEKSVEELIDYLIDIKKIEETNNNITQE